MRPLFACLTVVVLSGSAGAARPARAQDADKTPAPSFQERAEKMIEEITPLVEKYRGLKFKFKVKAGVKDKKALQEFLLKSLDEEVKPEEWAQFKAVYRKLGLVPKEGDVKQYIIDLLTDAVAGFYDPRTKQLYLIELPMSGAIADMMFEMSMAHELTHALEDQYYDLADMIEAVEDNSDAVIARKCIVEGSASLLGFEYLLLKRSNGQMDGANEKAPDLEQQVLQSLQMGQTPVIKRTPNILKLPLMFPYHAGAGVVQGFRKSGKDWADVDDFFINPPVSSEQILHREKYFDKDKVDYPVEISAKAFTDALPKEWKTLRSDVIGEFQLGVCLRTSEKKPDADKAADGWDGDTLVSVETGDKRIVLGWHTRWDSDDEAAQFFDAYRKFTLHRYAKAALVETKEENTSVYDTDDNRVVLQRKGNVVVILEGTTEAETNALLPALWKCELSYDERDPAKPALAQNVRKAVKRIPKEWAKDWKYPADGGK